MMQIKHQLIMLQHWRGNQLTISSPRGISLRSSVPVTLLPGLALRQWCPELHLLSSPRAIPTVFLARSRHRLLQRQTRKIHFQRRRLYARTHQPLHVQAQQGPAPSGPIYWVPRKLRSWVLRGWEAKRLTSKQQKEQRRPKQSE